MELKVFTLPTCKNCLAAKNFSQGIAQKHGVKYTEVDMGTPDDCARPHELSSICFSTYPSLKGSCMNTERLVHR